MGMQGRVGYARAQHTNVLQCQHARVGWEQEAAPHLAHFERCGAVPARDCELRGSATGGVRRLPSMARRQLLRQIGGLRTGHTTLQLERDSETLLLAIQAEHSRQLLRAAGAAPHPRLPGASAAG